MTTRMRDRVLAVAAAGCAMGLMAMPALADAIDGDWCNGASHFNIEGETILTPGRNRIQGRYTRYSFAYVVPPTEPGAGSEIGMVMVRGQEIVQLTRPGQSAGPEIWRRCKPIS